MEWIGYLACFVAGALAARPPHPGKAGLLRVWQSQTSAKGRRSGTEQRPEKNIAQQYENFFNYDGTERGQKPLED